MYVEFEVSGEILGYAGRIDCDALPAGGSTGRLAVEPMTGSYFSPPSRRRYQDPHDIFR